MVDLVLIQWGVVGLFVLIHFLLGFLRGAPKSTYYTIVSIIMTFVTLWIVSMFTIRWFFSPETLLVLINNYAGGFVPAEFQVLIDEYFTDPQISGFIFAIVDLVLRIIGFILIYPLLKTSITFTFFRPIWKRAILPKLLDKQNEKGMQAHEETFANKKEQKRYKKKRRLKKSFLSRLGGATAGAVRGFLVAFIFLLPIIVIGGFISNFESATAASSQGGPQLVSDAQEINSLIPSEFQGYLDMVIDMHNNGLGGIAEQIQIGGKGVDRYLFDMVFTTDVVAGDQVTAINFGNELESITGLASVVTTGGYLDPNFDPMTIDQTDLENLEAILGYIGRSDLLGYIIPTATRFGVKNFLTDMIGVDLYERETSAAALAEFEAIVWEEEFMRIYDILDAVLTFGSLQEWMDYAQNPALLAELTPEEASELADVIRAFAELRTLVLLNVGVDFAISSEQLRSQVNWVEEAEKEAYLAERFAFITSNVDFFVGEESDWAQIADMIEVFFSEDFADADLAAILGDPGNPEVLLNPDNADLIGALLAEFVEIELIINSIPFGVDFGIYNALGDQVERDLADRIAETLGDVAWDDELLNVGDIYKEIAKLGIASAFGDNPDYYQLIDDIAVNNMTELRNVVEMIFNESAVVNAAVEIAAPIIIDTMIEDEGLKEIAENALYNAPDATEVDFDFGYEINQLLTIIEIVNEFSSTSELMSMTGATTPERLEFISAFGTLSEARLTAFQAALDNLQILDRTGAQGLQYVKDTTENELIYVPSEVNLGGDIGTIFGLLHYVGGYLNANEATYGLLEDIDLTAMFEDDAFRALLLSTPANAHSNLLFLTIASNIKSGLGGLGLEEYLTIPQELVDADVEDDIWEIETNSLLETVLNLFVSMSATDNFTLSIRGISEATADSSVLIDSGLTAFLGLIDANVDLDTGKDDFDRFLDSKIIYVSISELLTGDFLTTTLSDGLAGTLGPDTTVDLSAPASIIGVDGVDEDVEVGRITKAEVKKIFSSFKALGVTNPAEISELGAAVITNMIDPEDPNDDFSVFLESDYLYVIIARLFNLDALGNFLQDALGGALGGGFDDVSMLPPTDAVGTTGVEEGLMTRAEVRQLFVSFKLLSPDGSFEGIGVNNVLDLIDDELLPGETDDFYLFLESKYMWDKISQLLLADGIVELIAAGRYTADEFVLPASTTVTIDTEERLTQDEIHHLFSGLKQLGIGDLDTIDINIETILGLTESEIDELLQSNYLYTVIDMTIKTEETLSLPSGAFEDAGEFLGMIKKTEIKDVFETLNILQITDLTNVSPESITIAQVNQVLTDTDSFVVNYLLSDAIVQALGEDKIPDEAFLDGDRTQSVLSDTELDALMEALTVLAGGDDTQPITDIDTTNISVGNVEALKDNESFVIKQLISDAIVDIIGLENIPDGAFIVSGYSGIVLMGASVLAAPTNRLTDAEIEAMIDAIVILANGDRTVLVTAISTDVTVGQTQQLSVLPSLVIKQLVTDSIKDVIDPDNLGKIPLDAYVDGVDTNVLTDDEISEMVAAILILANNDTTVLVTAISTDVNVGQVKQFKTNNSLIIKQLVSDSIVDTLSATSNIPDAAYIGSDPTSRLTDDEINEMIDAIDILAGGDDAVLVTAISTDVTVGQVKLFKTNNSIIIKQLVSDSIVDTLSPTSNIPDAAYIGSDPTSRLTDDEINEMIDAIDILAGGNDALLVTAISTDVTVGQVKAFQTNNSIIIKQLVSDSIVDTLSPTSNIPNEAYIDSDPLNRLTDTEINEMIDAIDILAGGNDALLVSAISTDVTVGQVKAFQTNNSIIIKQLVSDSIVDTLSVSNTIPNEAYIDSNPLNRLTDTEISEMIDAIDILAGGNDALLVSAISTDVTVGQVKQFKTNNSIIIKQLVSDSIIDTISVTNTIPNDAYIGNDPLNRLTDDEINEMIDAIDILAGGNDALLVSAVSTDVTVGQTQSLKTNASVIIRQLISDSITDQLSLTTTIPDDAYIDPIGKERLTDTEINEMIDALYILANQDDSVLVTAISTDVTIGQLKGLATSPSLIMRRLITDSIVDTIDPAAEGKIPLAAYESSDTNGYLTYDEVNDMIGALEILANSEVAGDRDHVAVSSLSPDITLGQLDSLTSSESLIMQQLINDSIIDAVGASKVPDDAYILDDPSNNLKSAEIDAMVDALYILAYDPLNPGADLDEVKVANVNFNVTVGQTQDLKTNESVIIKQVISDSIVDMLTLPKIRETAFNDPVAKDRLTDAEIGYMIDSLLILSGGDEDVLVTAITVNESALSVSTLKQFNENSIVLNRLISNAIIDGLGEAEMPNESFEDDVARTDLIRPEIDALLDALDILGIGTSGAGTIATNQLTFTKIDQVIAIGTSDAINYPLGFSPIVVHVLSDPMIAAVSDVRSGHEYGVPSTAYRNTYDLLHPEIEGLIDALKLIGNVQPEDEDTTTIADITINANNFNGTLISNMVALDKLIVYRLISKGINDSSIDTTESHVTDVLARNYDPNLPVTPLVYDIKIAEMNHIATSMDILGITSIASIATDITLAGLQTLSDPDVEVLVEADTSGPNTIIYHIIAETVDPSNNVFDTLVILNPITYPGPADDYYVMDGPTRVRLKRTSIALALDAL